MENSTNDVLFTVFRFKFDNCISNLDFDFLTTKLVDDQ